MNEYYILRMPYGVRGWWNSTQKEKYLYLSIKKNELEVFGSRAFDGLFHWFVLTREIKDARQFSSIEEARKILGFLEFALEDGYHHYDNPVAIDQLECVKIKHHLREESFEVINE